MPYRYNFYAGGYYHIYNRGVEKRPIFRQEKDYFKLISIFSAYLSPQKDPTLKRHPVFDKEIELFCFSLMPNHFHLLLRQKANDSISRFMKCVWNAYSSYFNVNYERVGPIFQGRFKAKEVGNDAYLLDLSRYIHRNSIGLTDGAGKTRPLLEYRYSSYRHYLNLENMPFVHSEEILSFFNSSRPGFSYQNFVENDNENESLLKDFIFDET